jgi:hypothetical protein
MTSPDQTTEGILGVILAATTESMLAELRAIRASFSHNGIVGTSVEEIVSKFLNSHLPGSARAVAGQVIDHTGARSKQMDVIIYDATRTPMLFASSIGTQNLVPAEGVIAVVEVKTALTRKELRKSAENCASVKRLDRSALAKGQILKEFSIYGSTWIVPPIFYSIFAFESDGLYAEALNDEIDQGLPLPERIDSLVGLDRGVCLNAAARVLGEGHATGIETYFSACPNPETVRMNIETAGALAAWFGVFMSTVLERIPGPEIDITLYLQKELQFSAQVGSGSAVRAMNERLQREFAKAIGLDPALLQKFGSQQAVSLSELYELLVHPMFHPGEHMDVQTMEQFRLLQQSARSLTREQWLKTWFADRDSNESINQD